RREPGPIRRSCSAREDDRLSPPAQPRTNPTAAIASKARFERSEGSDREASRQGEFEAIQRSHAVPAEGGRPAPDAKGDANEHWYLDEVAWLGVSVALGFVGLAVLAVCSFKVYLGVRRLGRELERARRRLEPQHSGLRDELALLHETREAQSPGDGVRSS
ncbi:hypothetical protein ACFQ07_15155, partial [Actinomadura adrarensis]